MRCYIDLKKVVFLFYLLLGGQNTFAASYGVQQITATSFDNTTTDVVWTNDSGQTGFPIDDDYELVNIGFTFSFGAVDYTQVRILGNGALHFGSDQGFHKDYTNEALPITGSCNGQGVSCPGPDSAANRVILPYWDDLEPSAGGSVTYDTLGTSPDRRFAVTWDNVRRFGSTSLRYTFQVVLYENGDILFRYGDDDVDGQSATIGVEVDDSDYTQFSFNTSAVNDNTDLFWQLQFPDIQSVSASCDDLDKVTVVFDDDVSAALATDDSLYALDNGATITAANQINTTTVELTTSTLSIISYTLSISQPAQSQSFTPSSTATTTVTYRDQFSSSSFSNNDGSGTWASSWVESEESSGGTGPSAGNITISSNQLRFDDRPNSGGEPAIYREVDLSGATSATLTYDYDTSNNLENSDRFDVAVSSNGGASYTIVANYSDDVNGSANIDLTPYLSSNTRIRFRVENNYGGNSEAMFIDNVLVTEERSEACPTATIDHFRVSHDTAAINCRAELVTVNAEDASDNVVDDYTDTITLSTSTNRGTWALVTGAGTFSDSVADDGAATYTYADADDGVVILSLYNTVQESVNIAVTSGSIVDEDSEGLLTFRPVGFDYTPNPIPTQIAGQPFSITLTAVGETPSDPDCGVIEEYTGSKNLRFWSTYDNPASGSTAVVVDGTAIAGSEASSAAQTLTFTNGVATPSVSYTDAGRISIGVKDDVGLGDPATGTGTELVGGMSPFVVRPFAFYIELDSNPNATGAADAVYKRAGEDFLATLKAVVWEAGDSASNNQDLANNALTPNFSQHGASVSVSLTHSLQAPSGGVTGTLTGGGALTDFNSPANGEKQVTLTWDEVGIITLSALTENYLGSSESITGSRSNIGRFIPDHFTLSNIVQSAACSSFNYGGYKDGSNAGLDRVGQAFTASGDVQAENLANNVTLNYTGDFAKLAVANIQANPRNGGLAAAGSLNFSVELAEFSGSDGQYNFTDDDAHYQFQAESAPFDLSLRYTISDSDGVSLDTTYDSNAVEQRLGRARLGNSHGPETENLSVDYLVEYFDGNDYITNTVDNCSIYNGSNITLSNYTDNLQSGETSILSPLSNTLVISGDSNPLLPIVIQAPGVGNEGTVNLTMDISAWPWLRFDSDGDQNVDDPQSNVLFGRFRGSDRVIYWEEL